MDKIMEELKKSRFFKRLLETNGDEILCIYVSGSRIYGLEDSASDYDINIVTRSFNARPSIYLGYNEEYGIEWFFNPLSAYTETSERIHPILRNFQINYIKDDDILYRGENADEFLSLRSNNKDENGIDLALKNLYSVMKRDFIIPILAHHEEKLPKATKYVYHLCVGYHYLTKTALNKDYLIQIKRKHYTELSEDVKQYVINCLAYLSNIIK